MTVFRDISFLAVGPASERSRLGNNISTIMPAKIREFGTTVVGENYILRPGGYGVVRNSADAVAIVTTSRGAFLLGGAQEGVESPQQALIREAREECGCTLSIGEPIGVADELLFAKDEKAYFRKRCAFFIAEIVACDAASAIEADHALEWLPIEEATRRLIHESHRWDISIVMNRSNKKDAEPCAAANPA